MRPPIYTPETIALVKGIYAAGIWVKKIAKETQIPMPCIASWCYNRRKLEVREDPEPQQLLAGLYQKVVYSVRAEKEYADGREDAPSANDPAATEAKPSDSPEPGTP